VAILAYGLFGGVGGGGRVAGLLAVGAIVVFIGVAAWSYRLVRPLAGAVGYPLERWRGVTGRLARENAVRNPGRTANTAAALMIGLALVTFVAIFAAGTRGSVDKAIDEGVRSQLVIQNTDGFSPFSATVDAAVGRVRGVEFATPLRFGESKVEGIEGNTSVTGLDPRTGSQVFHLEWKQGSQATLAALGDRDAVVDERWADDHGVRLGDRLTVTTPKATEIELAVQGTYEDRLDFGGDYIVPAATLATEYGVDQNSVTLVKLRPGADAGAVQKAIERILDRDFPNTEVLSKQEWKDDQARQINQLLGIIYVLLGLSVIVSLFGIVNTLALSIHERTRELGMLRAIGTSRRQVRRLVRYESVITALLGAALGAVLGVFFAVVISRPLEEDGFTLSFPVGTMIVLLVLAALAGVLAAIGPARRAARLDVLEALAYE
jgi:putative ABC transport system permease protein